MYLVSFLECFWKTSTVCSVQFFYNNFKHILSTVFFSKLDFLNPNHGRSFLNPTLSQYRDYLETRYEPQQLISSTQWPPLPVNKVFKLAMIRKEEIQRGRIDDEFIRLTITGKVDDILQKKTPVDLDNIFSECDRRRKLVLVEGAPGSGKSTVCLHICQDWAEGKLFQEYCCPSETERSPHWKGQDCS